MQNMLTRAMYVFLGLFSLSVVGQGWVAYKTSQLDSLIEEQLEGKLSATAREIVSLREEVKTARASLLKASEVQERASVLMEGMSAETRARIEAFIDETGAKIEDISVRFTSIETTLKRGSATRGAKPPTPTPPPPPEWKGVSAEDQKRCESYPEKCAPFPFTWEANERVNGKSIGVFSTPNLWGEEFSLRLNLAYRVQAITFRGEGVVRNQGVYIQAGYFNDKKEFVMVAEDKLLSGDPNLDPQLFYTATTSTITPSVKSLRLLEPSALVGVNWALGGFGLAFGASLLNLNEGRYRLGGNITLVSGGGVLAGVMGSYHPRILGKNINIAPSVGAAWDTQLTTHLTLGLFFQVW